MSEQQLAHCRKRKANKEEKRRIKTTTNLIKSNIDLSSIK
ncbi:MAG: hypothetical protein ACI8RD_005573 [Bacillariaceae sp.]|jgi:hypothetical protein